MPAFKIKADVIVTYEYEVEADTIAEAVAMVEDGTVQDCVERDSSTEAVTHYTIDGQMGWNEWEGEE
tara:strand:- start:16060 stop:16260 length:201 start_codon:yes stop_codon:yes gene_type:complete